jgi:tetratricopeptide (TPR) repeat protein
MKTTKTWQLLVADVAVCCTVLLPSLAVAADESAPPATIITNEASTNAVAVAQQALQAYLLAQEQLRVIQRDIEQSRKDAEAAAQRNAESLAARLSQIGQELSSQRQRESETMQDSNRAMLIVAGAFAAIGFLAMVFTAWFQMRSLNRLAEVAGAIRLGNPHDYPLAALGAGESHSAALDPVEHSNMQFLGAIERLQKRIHELEQSTASNSAASENGHSHGEMKESAENSEQSSSTDANPSAALGPAVRAALILGKGQTQLNLGNNEEALACFEEALTLDPANIEALLKKGTVLERLQRMEEAIDTYDRAIAVDNSKTTAYLLKGGVFNRMKRYPEALECYDEALRAQQKVPAT